MESCESANWLWKVEYGVSQQVVGLVVLGEEGEGFMLSVWWPSGNLWHSWTLQTKSGLFGLETNQIVSSNPNLSIKCWKNPGRWEKDGTFLNDMSGQLSVLCWFWQPPSWPGGRHLLADQLSNVYFQPSPSTGCLLLKWQDRKGQQGHEGEMSGVTRKPGRCEGNWRYCKAKCYRDMEGTMKGLRGHVVNLDTGSREGLFGVEEESCGTLNCRKSRFSSSAPQGATCLQSLTIFHCG